MWPYGAIVMDDVGDGDDGAVTTGSILCNSFLNRVVEQIDRKIATPTKN